MLQWYSGLSSLLGTGVELVEALTIILAVGVVRGWKGALTGAVTAVGVLGALVVIIGAPLVNIIQIPWVALFVGIIMLLFGIRWLRKSILRYSGLKSLHHEEESYQEEVERQRRILSLPSDRGGRVAFATTFGATFLEGLEAVFIVITIGTSSHTMTDAVAGAVTATIATVVVGFLLRRPLTKVPENTMKFIVGIMLTSFGAYWFGEGLLVPWPQKDLSLVYLVASLLVLSWILVLRARAQLARFHQTIS